MSRPSLTDIVSGQQSWDVTHNDNLDVMGAGPFPLVEYTDEADLIASAPPSSNDRCLAGTADGTLWISDGTTWHALGKYPKGFNGAFGGVKAKHEQITLSGASKSSAADAFPNGSYRLAALYYVSTTATSGDGGTDMDVGDGTDVDLYGAAVAFASGTSGGKTNKTAPVFSELTAQEAVVFTCNGGTFSGGVVELVTFYIDFDLPTT